MPFPPHLARRTTEGPVIRLGLFRARITGTTERNILSDNNCRAVVLLTTPQLAKRWHMSEGHLRNLRAAGVGPSFIKLGSRVLYPLTAIEAYEAARVFGDDAA